MDQVEDPLQGLQLRESGAGKRKTFPEISAVQRLVAKFKPAANGIWQLKQLPSRGERAHQRAALLDELIEAVEAAKRHLIVDTAVLPMLQREKERITWSAEYSRRKQSLLAKSPLASKLYPYQKQGVEMALIRGRLLLGDDMGLGKTYQGIAWAEALLCSGTIKRLLVITPAALKEQWRREWRNATGRQVIVVEGMPDERTKIYRQLHPVLLVNYELLLRDFDEIAPIAGEAVILDEAQRIKNYATQTAQQVKRLHPRFRLVLTGTPMENRIQELCSLMDWVDNNAMGPYWRLDAELAFGDGSGNGKSGVQGLHLIRERLRPHFLRRKREEVLKQLPPRTDTPMTVAVTEPQIEIHKELAAKVAKLMQIMQDRPLTPEEHIRLMALLTKMRIVSNGLAQFQYDDLWPSLKHDISPEKRIPSLSSPKLGIFRSLVEGLLPQNGVKVVVFSQWQRMLHLAHWSIRDLLEEADHDAVFFTGSESQKRRTENIVRFHDDPDVRFFFATDAGGVGLNLQKAASVCINLELPWNPAVLEQRIGRIYRLGQNDPVQIFNLITEGTIEERITSLVGRKRAVFTELFDGTSNEVVFDDKENFYRQINTVMQEFVSPPEVAAATEEAESDEDLAQLNDVIEENQINVEEEIPIETISSERTLIGAVSGSALRKEHDPTQKESTASLGSNLTTDLAEAFRGIKIQQTPEGRLQLEADGSSAKLLADVFRGLASLFEGR